MSANAKAQVCSRVLTAKTGVEYRASVLLTNVPTRFGIESNFKLAIKRLQGIN